MQDAATVEEKIEKLDPQKNGAPINPKRRTEPMSHMFISLTFHIKRPGGMREAFEYGGPPAGPRRVKPHS